MEVKFKNARSLNQWVADTWRQDDDGEGQHVSQKEEVAEYEATRSDDKWDVLENWIGFGGGTWRRNYGEKIVFCLFASNMCTNCRRKNH